MLVMGLDLSTKTGVAIVDTDKNVVFAEEIEFKKMTGWPRIGAIAGRIMELREQYQPDLIMIEELFVGHASSAIVLAQISSVVHYFLWQDNHKFMDVSASGLKKWLTQKGNAQKDVMMMEVYKQFGYESRTNNIADAVALGMLGVCYFTRNFTKQQVAEMDKIVAAHAYKK